MIDIIFRDEALADLKSIRDYFTAYSNETAERVAKDIEATLHVLETFPESGTQKSYNRRQSFTTKYRFRISYQYRNNRIEVLGIYRFQNR